MVYVTKPTTISRHLKLTGGLEAENEAMVLSKSSEKIDKVLVKIGDAVTVDQVLMLQSNQILQQGIAQPKLLYGQRTPSTTRRSAITRALNNCIRKKSRANNSLIRRRPVESYQSSVEQLRPL